MTRLRLWLARLLLPRGWGIVPVQPGLMYAMGRAGETLRAGELVGLLPPTGPVPPGYHYGVDWCRDNEPHADTLGQDDIHPGE